MNELQTARYKERVGWLSLRALDEQIRNLQQAAGIGRLEHDEVVQVRHSLASLARRRASAKDDWLSWHRVVARLEGKQVSAILRRTYVDLAGYYRRHG